jgi:hypothetical protein
MSQRVEPFCCGRRMLDFGYDVSEYCAVDPQFGTLDDFDRLVSLLLGAGLKLLLDFVPNVACSLPRHIPKPDSMNRRQCRQRGSSAFAGPFRARRPARIISSQQNAFGRCTASSAYVSRWPRHTQLASQRIRFGSVVRSLIMDNQEARGFARGPATLRAEIDDRPSGQAAAAIFDFLKRPRFTEDANSLELCTVRRSFIVVALSDIGSQRASQ